MTRSAIVTRALGGILAITVLAGCSPQLPGRESFETAIPAALLASDLGITSATAEKSASGFAVGLSVHIVLDRDAMTSDELAHVLAIVVQSNNLSNPSELRVSARDATATGAEAELPLSAVGEQLGFTINPTDRDPLDFDADWDAVLAFVEEQSND